MAQLEIATHGLLHSDWRTGLPSIAGNRVALRELRRTDAFSLYQVVQNPDVARHMWPAPPSVRAMEQFIEATWAERTQGRYAGFGIVPSGSAHAAGLFELRSSQPGFLRAELGFFLDRSCWGTGVFAEAAGLMREFAFGVLRTHRIEARVSIENRRGNAVMRKMGATKEGVLQDAFHFNGRYIDQYLWAMLNRVATASRLASELGGSLSDV